TGALDFKEVPKRLIVIGAGVIGLELGSVWNRLGSEVICVEYLDQVAPFLDGEVGTNFKRILEKQGIKFKLGTKVVGAEKTANGVRLAIESAKGGSAET